MIIENDIMNMIRPIEIVKTLYEDYKNKRIVRTLRRLSDEDKCKMNFSERYVELMSTSDVSEWMQENLLPNHIGVVMYTPVNRGCSLVQLMVNDEKEVHSIKRAAFVYAMKLSIELDALLSSRNNVMIIENKNN